MKVNHLFSDCYLSDTVGHDGNRSMSDYTWMLTFHTLILHGFFIYIFLFSQTNRIYNKPNRIGDHCNVDVDRDSGRTVPTSPWIKSTAAEATVVVAKYLLTSSLCFAAHVCMCILPPHCLHTWSLCASFIYMEPIDV